MAKITYELTKRRQKGWPRRATKPALRLSAVVESSNIDGTRVTLFEEAGRKTHSVYKGKWTLRRPDALAKAEARAIRIATFWGHAGLTIAWPD